MTDFGLWGQGVNIFLQMKQIILLIIEIINNNFRNYFKQLSKTGLCLEKSIFIVTSISIFFSHFRIKWLDYKTVFGFTNGTMFSVKFYLTICLSKRTTCCKPAFQCKKSLHLCLIDNNKSLNYSIIWIGVTRVKHSEIIRIF